MEERSVAPFGLQKFPTLLSKPEVKEALLLAEWDNHIRRQATRAASICLGGDVVADDFAQEARIKLLKAIRHGRPLEARYIRTLIKNRVRNAVRDFWRAAKAVGHEDYPLARQYGEQLRRWDDDTDYVEQEIVARWAERLPQRLQATYGALYVEGLTQREAAAKLGVSQPRVAQLHRELIAKGRQDLAHLRA